MMLFTSGVYLPCYSIDPQGAAFSINAETRDINVITEVQKINQLLDEMEKNWNAHDIEKVMENYSEDFVNGDGLDLEAVKNLTLELWDAYSDIQSKSLEKGVRVFGEYATVESLDSYVGSSSRVREEVGSKGFLSATSRGNLFLRKFGPTWKITSDKTTFEKVSIGYGLGTELINQNKVKFIAPEQVVGGQQYTASIDFELPETIKPVAAISKEVLLYPQYITEDKFRLINEPVLEKLLQANKISKNELVTATVGLTGGALKPKLLGLLFLTRRVNVVPISEQEAEVSIIKSPAKQALNKEVDFLDIYQNDEKNKQKDNKENKDSEDKPPADLDQH